LALPIFIITIFVSSSLLFLVQPMVGKMILPRLGGAPQVWNTCMVFFQAALLAGYGYTHTASTRLPLRRQILVHCLLLLVPFLFLLVVVGKPFNFDWFTPPPGGNPIWQTLLVLTIVVGVPFFVVATSAPLLQKWFANTGHPTADDPYYLYAASNLGSLIALLGYPVLVEPNLGLRAQAWMWTAFYTLLVILVGACALVVWKAPARVQLAGATPAEPPPPPAEPRPAAASTAVTAAPRHARVRGRNIRRGTSVRPAAPEATPSPAPVRTPARDEVTVWRRLRWIALAAIPSSLMLGVTTYMTIDISAITYLWVIPLSLYLLSFILVFLRWPLPWTEVPHTLVVIVQPFVLLFLVYSRIARPGWSIQTLIILNLLAFFVTALVCHGELAKDRPSTRYLTEFYLWMSVGGVLGGIFNAIISPILFVGIVEYPLALALAGFLRPSVWRSGLIDLGLASALPDMADKGPEPAPSSGPGRRRLHAPPPPVWPQPKPAVSYTLDVVLGVGVGVIAMLGMWFTSNTRNWVVPATGELTMGYYLIRFIIPLILGLFLLGRPLRYGLGLSLIILVHAIHASSQDERNLLFADRSYFGVLRVYKMESGEYGGPAPLTKEEMELFGTNSPDTWYTYLMHGTTYHGQNYQTPQGLRRLATTYYHRLGPVGAIMDHFNWFKDRINFYHSDARLPTSVVGAGAVSPLAQLVSAWSEPAYATIGLGTGTMASYARPYQQITFYDIDQHIVNFSIPPPGREMFFNYLHDAKARGAKTEVIMGDARLSMAEELPERATFFHKRDNYYHAIIVDAFSSDAIPVHLITEEAIRMYFSKLAEDGVLCVHTSNRHVELIKPVADIAAALKLKYRVGHDLGEHTRDETGDRRGWFTSEWIMLARDDKFLPDADKGLENCTFAEAEHYAFRMRQGGQNRLIWYTPRPPGMALWTDDYSNLLSVFRWRW
jgi:hypothetical protein